MPQKEEKVWATRMGLPATAQLTRFKEESGGSSLRLLLGSEAAGRERSRLLRGIPPSAADVVSLKAVDG